MFVLWVGFSLTVFLSLSLSLCFSFSALHFYYLTWMSFWCYCYCWKEEGKKEGSSSKEEEKKPGEISTIFISDRNDLTKWNAVCKHIYIYMAVAISTMEKGMLHIFLFNVDMQILKWTFLFSSSCFLLWLCHTHLVPSLCIQMWM